MSEQHGLGRLPAPDPRDRRYLMSPPAEPQTLPAYRHYQCGAVLDQGPYPHCVGYAWRAWLSAAHLMTKGGPQPVNIYAEAQKVDEWPGEGYDGTSVRAGAKVLQALGHISAYAWAWSADDVAAFLLGNGGTCVLGTAWTGGMMRSDDRGFIAPSGNVVGGHAYLAVGYSRTRGVFRLLNSWGRSWSQGGRAWILGEHLDVLIRDGGEACAGTEVRHELVP